MRNNRPSVMALLSWLAVALPLLLGTLTHQPSVTQAASLSAPIAELPSDPLIDSVPDVPPSMPTEVPSSFPLPEMTPTPDVLIIVVAPTVVVADTSEPSATPGAVFEVTKVATVTPSVRGRTQVVAGVPILMYHYIRVNPVASDKMGFNLSVTPNDFAFQMRFLVNHGFAPVAMAEVASHVRNNTPLPNKPIAITFDDGYADAYTAALPILARYHMTATFYIVTGFVDRPRYVTWDQVVSLDRLGMEIASHTVHHEGLTVLGGLKRQTELVDSRTELERRLGHPVLDFCYPGGQIDPPSEIAVARAGYLSATTTAYGRAEVGTDALRLPRIRVSGGESLATFAELLGEKAGSADYRSTPLPTALSG